MLGAHTRVAIVDDDQSVGTAISRLLKASDMTVDIYTTGFGFLASREKHEVDCLILDLQMPGMDGMAVLNDLAQEGSRLPVVMITAHDQEGVREDCLRAGATFYLRKPIDAAELIAAIDAAVRPAGHSEGQRAG